MAEKASGSEHKRNTKNSLKVAAFENQNRILKLVLEASEKLDKTNSTRSAHSDKEPNSRKELRSENSEEKSPGGGGLKRNVDSIVSQEGLSQANSGKKQKVGKEIPQSTSFNDLGRVKLILPYPGYEDEYADGTGWNQSYQITEGSRDVVGLDLAGTDIQRQRVAKATTSVSTTPAAAGSSETMYTPLLFGDRDHQISDNSDDESYDPREGWDNTSLASSAIFQGSRKFENDRIGLTSLEHGSHVGDNGASPRKQGTRLKD